MFLFFLGLTKSLHWSTIQSFIGRLIKSNKRSQGGSHPEIQINKKIDPVKIKQLQIIWGEGFIIKQTQPLIPSSTSPPPFPQYPHFSLFSSSLNLKSTLYALRKESDSRNDRFNSYNPSIVDKLGSLKA